MGQTFSHPFTGFEPTRYSIMESITLPHGAEVPIVITYRPNGEICRVVVHGVCRYVDCEPCIEAARLIHELFGRLPELEYHDFNTHSPCRDGCCSVEIQCPICEQATVDIHTLPGPPGEQMIISPYSYQGFEVYSGGDVAENGSFQSSQINEYTYSHAAMLANVQQLLSCGYYNVAKWFQSAADFIHLQQLMMDKDFDAVDPYDVGPLEDDFTVVP